MHPHAVLRWSVLRILCSDVQIASMFAMHVLGCLRCWPHLLRAEPFSCHAFVSRADTSVRSDDDGNEQLRLLMLKIMENKMAKAAKKKEALIQVRKKVGARAGWRRG